MLFDRMQFGQSRHPWKGCWRWLCVALVAAIGLGPGGLERLHVGMSHDHGGTSLATRGQPDGSRSLKDRARMAPAGAGREMASRCEVCQELAWARLGQTGTGAPAIAPAPTEVVAERVQPIAEQARSIRATIAIRSRAPPAL